MRAFSVMALLAIMLIGCATTNELPPVSQIKPSVAEEGSLANEKLIGDTIAGLGKFASITPDSKILKFVIQQPVGKSSSQAWREMWIVNPEGASARFVITFKEAGLGAANFEIQAM
jgi:hypothetical protein